MVDLRCDLMLITVHPSSFSSRLIHFLGFIGSRPSGRPAHDFEHRVVETVVSQLPARSDLDYSVRTTPGGRHIALTLDITVQNAEQVRAIYAEVRELEGLTLLF